MKYQHENPNIEIINKNLWAVRFSLIPFIPQISWKPDTIIPANKVPFQLSPSGVLVLNKDFPLYDKVKAAIQRAMKMSRRQLTRELAQRSAVPHKNHEQILCLACLQTERERQRIQKGGATNGNDQNDPSNV